MNTRIAVVVPARDEAERIDACLTSIAIAALELGVRVDVIVVADGCLDDTAARARHHGAHVLETRGSNVGGARAAGARRALRRGATWLAGTDADSTVPADWLAVQLALEQEGVDVVVGSVRPRFAELDPAQIDAWHLTHDAGQSIGHVHGANLGIRASAYVRVGGYRELPEHEDTDLVERLRVAGARFVATAANEVETSGRSVGRTPGGYARYLRDDLLPHSHAPGRVNPVT